MAGNTTVGQWTNSDGLRVKFPQYFSTPSTRTNKPTAEMEILGPIHTLVVPFDLTQLAAGNTSYTADLTNAGTLNGFSEGDPHLPANSTILDTWVFTTTAATGGTSITVGTYQLNGTAISATSLVTATEGVIANMTPAGKRINGNGALLNHTQGNAVVGVGVNNAFPAITTAGTFTAGAGFVVITYIEANPELFANN